MNKLQAQASGERPLGVILVAASNLIVGILLFIFELITFLSLVSSFTTNPASRGDLLIDVLAGGLFVVALPFTIMFDLAAIGIWRLRKWGLILTAINGALCLLVGFAGIYGATTSPNSGGLLSEGGTNSMVAMLAGLVMLFFLVQKSFRVQFT